MAILLASGGCGGSRQTGSQEDIEQVRQARRQQEEKDKKEHVQQLAQKQSAKERKEAEAANKRQEALARHGQQNTPSRRKRPDDVQAWRKRDFYEARAQSDRKLIPAVEYLGNAFVGNVHAARLLKEILFPEPLPDATSSAPRSASPRVARGADVTTDAIVRALIRNDTPLARETLEWIVLTPPVDRVGEDIAERALERLAEAPTARTESLLLRALEQTCAKRGMGIDRSDAWDTFRGRLTETAFAHGASEAFRAALAECANQPDSPSTLRARYASLLEQPMPENLRAQVILFRGAATSEESRVRLETPWAAYGSEAVRRLLGGPAPSPAPSRGSHANAAGLLLQAQSAAVADSGVVSRVREHLWNKPLTTLIGNRLDRANSLKQNASTIVLASTIPRDSTRSRLRGALLRNWHEGPEPLRDAGLIDVLTPEPGFWLVLKTCRFEQADRNDTKLSGSARRPGRGTSVENDPWHAAAGRILLATCSRLEEATELRQLAALGEGRAPVPASVPESLPIRPGDNAQLVAELHVAWPDGATASDSPGGPDPTKVWYALFHETDVPERVATYYRRQMKSPRVHVGPEGAWFECVDLDEDTHMARSIDVVIQTAPSAPSARKNEPQPLTIKILVVEVRDPTGHPNDPSGQSADHGLGTHTR